MNSYKLEHGKVTANFSSYEDMAEHIRAHELESPARIISRNYELAYGSKEDIERALRFVDDNGQWAIFCTAAPYWK